MSKAIVALGVVAALFAIAAVVFFALWITQRCTETGSGTDKGLGEGNELLNAEENAPQGLPSGVAPEPEMKIATIARQIGAPEVMLASIGGVASNAVTEFLEANGCQAITSGYRQLCHLAHPGFRTGLTYVYIEPDNCLGPLVSQARRDLTIHNTAKRWGHDVVDLPDIRTLHPEDALGAWQHRQSFRYAIRHGLDRIVKLAYPLTNEKVHAMYNELFGRDPAVTFQTRQSFKSRSVDAAPDELERTYITEAQQLWEAASLVHLGTLDLPYGATSPMLAPKPDPSTGLWPLVFRFTCKTNDERHKTRHNLHLATVAVGPTQAQVVGELKLNQACTFIPRPDDVKSVEAHGDWLVWSNLSATNRCPTVYSQRKKREICDAKKAGVASDPIEKNYTPFVTEDGRVMFIRWFFPLELYELDPETGKASCIHKGSSANDNTWRGGSNGCAVDKHTIFGFGRRTVMQHRSSFGLQSDYTHRVFYWQLDLRTFTVKTAPVNGPCGTISDPISLRKDGNRFLLTTVEGSRSFGRERLTLKCDMYQVDLKKFMF